MTNSNYKSNNKTYNENNNEQITTIFNRTNMNPIKKCHMREKINKYFFLIKILTCTILIWAVQYANNVR
ncbi:hypothetical protein PFUGPA_00354 [Plasmodium falciparum Palo Alto/Uganda]|uniref:Uncharacterized protein n=1 Tax=Plasmodium falciparum (isolate Palo Alto / Uganda) TaxID=57270 RepID=W4J7Q5_PLAFP|nr:hypothetical protein PFUGPA_00354 [Plasmodium falciparum Palo Alto/Uganda]